MFFLRTYVHISHVRAKKLAKLLLFFELTKYFYKKNQKKVHFSSICHFCLAKIGSYSLAKCMPKITTFSQNVQYFGSSRFHRYYVEVLS